MPLRHDLDSNGYRHIVQSVGVRGGTPAMMGTRIGVHDVIGLLQNGETIDTLQARCFPRLTSGRDRGNSRAARYVAERRRWAGLPPGAPVWREFPLIALFDTGFLYVLFDANAKIPPARDKKPIARGRERVEHLVHSLTEGRSTKIILPAPALSEFMLLAHEDWAGYLALIRKTSVFQIAGFDVAESVELVEHWFRHGDGKRLRYGAQQTWAKLK